MFERALTTVSFAFVDHHEYFGHDYTNARAQAVSAYDGQVEFTATPKSMMDFNINSIFAEVREFAEAFGNVRSFAYIETKGFQAPRFRAEYFSVKSAESAVAVSTQNDSACFSVRNYSLYFSAFAISSLLPSSSPLLTISGLSHRICQGLRTSRLHALRAPCCLRD